MMENMARRNLVIYVVCFIVLAAFAGLVLQAGKGLNKAFAPRGFLGIEYNESLIIQKVVPNSPAEDSGLQPGDRIVSIDGAKIMFQSDVNKFISENSAGSKIKITVLREGKKITLTATLAPKR